MALKYAVNCYIRVLNNESLLYIEVYYKPYVGRPWLELAKSLPTPQKKKRKEKKKETTYLPLCLRLSYGTPRPK